MRGCSWYHSVTCGRAQKQEGGHINKDSTGASDSRLIVLVHGAYLVCACAASAALSPFVDQLGLTDHAIMRDLSPMRAVQARHSGRSWRRRARRPGNLSHAAISGITAAIVARWALSHGDRWSGWGASGHPIRSLVCLRGGHGITLLWHQALSCQSVRTPHGVRRLIGQGTPGSLWRELPCAARRLLAPWHPAIAWRQTCVPTSSISDLYRGISLLDSC